MMRETRLTVLDLFSGSGGMSAGFDHHSDSFRIVGAVDKQIARPGNESNPSASTNCNATYEINLGGPPTLSGFGTRRRLRHHERDRHPEG